MSELENDVIDALRLGLTTKADISGRVRVAPDQVVEVLLRLEKQSFVQRRRHDANGAVWWELTTEGHRRR